MSITVCRLEWNMIEKYINFLIKERFLMEVRKEDVIVFDIIGQNNMSVNVVGCRKMIDNIEKGIMQKNLYK